MIRLTEVISAPVHEIPSYRTMWLVQAFSPPGGYTYVAITFDKALADWIAGQAPGRKVVQVTGDPVHED